MLERAIDILQCFDETNGKLTLHEVAEHSGLHKATAFRILSTLVDDRMLDQPVLGGPYELGFFALGRADAMLGTSALWHKAAPIMEQLRDELDETIVLAQRRDDRIVNLDKVVCRQGLIEAPTIGVWALLHQTPAGIAVLSTFGDTELEAYLGDHVTTPDARALRRQIAGAKAIFANLVAKVGQTFVPAVPIRNRGDNVVAALWTAIPSGRMEPAHVRRCLRRLMWASQKLGV